MERLTRQEAAEFLGCSRSAFYKLEKKGVFKGMYYEIGTKRLYIKTKLLDWIEKGGEAQCEAQSCALQSFAPWKGETNGKSNMKWILTAIKGATGAFITFISYLFGGFDVMFQVLMFCIIADYITGLMSAFYLGKLNSKVGFKGILKKIAILMVVALAVEIGRVTGMDAVRGLIMGFYIANEGISILENVGRMDVPYLSKLKDILEQLKDDKK